VVHVASSWRSREDEVEDGWVDKTGCIRLFYPNFVVFVVLGPRGILVFWLCLEIVGAQCHFSYYHFAFLRLVLVCHELNFIFNNQMREGGR
jgi:hypothetical protein